MKNLLNRLWFVLSIRKGTLVSADTVPVVMPGVVLVESKKIIGRYKDKHTGTSWCYVTGLDDRTYQVYTKSIRRVNATRNPELFI